MISTKLSSEGNVTNHLCLAPCEFEFTYSRIEITGETNT